MTESLIVETAFPNISDFAAGMSGRIQADRLIVFAAEPRAEGDTVEFQLRLADGSSGLAGRARVEASYDGWEEQPDSRPADMRYDIVLVDIEYDAMSEIVRDRVLDLGQDGERPTGEPPAMVVEAEADEIADDVDVEADDDESAGYDDLGGPDAPAGSDVVVASADESVAGPVDELPAGPDLLPAEDWAAGDDPTELEAPVPESALAEPAATGFTDDDETDSVQEFPAEGTQTVNLGEFEEVAGTVVEADASPPPDDPSANSLPPMPSSPAPVSVDHMLRPSNGSPLVRPSQQASWFPAAMEVDGPSQRGEAFAHLGKEFPMPQRPPRPMLDPADCVIPAPRPGSPGQSFNESPAQLSVEGQYAPAHEGSLPETSDLDATEAVETPEYRSGESELGDVAAEGEESDEWSYH